VADVPLRRSGLVAGAVFLLYLGASAALFGSSALRSASDRWVGQIGSDQSLFGWLLSWWPHALGDGSNPFVTKAVWAPQGFELVWATSVPGPALVASPLTLTAGPVAAFNMLMILAPALAAWTAFLLCRGVVRRTGAAVMGGAVFGFSAYMSGQMLGHLNLVLVFLIPLGALLVYRRLRGEISTRRYVVLLGVVVAGQTLVSTELLATATASLAVAAAILWIRKELRPAWPFVQATARGYGVGLLLVLPVVVSLLVADTPDWHPDRRTFSGDLLGLIVPTRSLQLHHGLDAISDRFTAGLAEEGTYIGLPLLVLVALFARERRRRHGTVGFLPIAFAAAIVAALGPLLHVAGRVLPLPLPWLPLLVLPVYRYAVPVRMMLFASLALAVMTAAWLSAATPGRGRLRFALAALGLVALLPNLQSSFRSVPVVQPAAFASEPLAAQLQGQRVLVLPFGDAGQSMLWQARRGFVYEMAGGYLGNILPSSYEPYRPLLDAFAGRGEYPDDPATLRDFLQTFGVDTVVVADGSPAGTDEALRAAGLRREELADVSLYPVAR
jgi:hypothetical protein